MKPPTSRSAFLSYAREDGEAASRLVADLTARGIAVWFDKDSIPGGTKWRKAITDGIRNSDVFLSLQSTTSIGKIGTVQREIRLALDVMKDYPEDVPFIIPLRLDDCSLSPGELQDLQCVDLFPKWEAGIRDLVEAILPDAGPGTPLHDVLKSVVASLADLQSTQPVEVRETYGSEECNVAVPRPQAERIFHNLIANAVKFTDRERRPIPTVEIETRVSAGNVRVSISNKGVGILYSDLGRVFDFGHVGEDSKGGSLGFGLPIARKIAEMIGWDITLTSVPTLKSGTPQVMRRCYSTVFTVHVPRIVTQYSVE
jgi:hypothetical protein